MTGLVTGLGSKLAERWMLLILTPAFAFWAGGVVAWATHRSWKELGDKIAGLSTAEQVAVAVGALLLVAASGVAVQRATLPILRILEGYWPEAVAAPVIAWRDRRINRKREEWVELTRKVAERRATAPEQRRHLGLDRRLLRVPAERSADRLTRRMPTALGNILRASESRPVDKYGLDAVKCWSRLWLLLPDTARSELTTARGNLDQAAGLLVWALLFIVWTVWAWWAAPIGLAVALVAHRMMLGSAAVYGDLLESTYDVHRRLLYEALHWPQPKTPAEERDLGEALTEYLVRGSNSRSPTFESGTTTT